jgi:hypothetical protein
MIQNKKTILIVAVFVIFLVAGCSSPVDVNMGQDNSNDGPVEQSDVNTVVDNTQSVTETPPETASFSATYKIEFIADWSASTHPDYYPADAHFSPFVAYSHNNSVNSRIFSVGQVPSRGVEEMSESGKTDDLIKEIGDLMDLDFAYVQTKGNRIDSPGVDSAELRFTQDYDYVTFVSMLAPSPDWFVSGSINLMAGDQWVDTAEVTLVTYDSGGDDGDTLTSKDQDSNPKQVVTVFNSHLQGLGKIILTKVGE